MTAMGDEENAIFKEIEGFLEAFNRGDAKAAASFYTEDGVRVGAFGDVQRGRVEIEAAYERLMHQMMPGVTAKQECGTVRMLAPNLAVWQGGLEIILPGGAPSMKGHVVEVLMKADERWLVVEGHPKLFPPQPTAH